MRKNLLIILLSFLFLSAHATHIGIDDAKKVATAHVRLNNKLKTNKSLDVQLVYTSKDLLKSSAPVTYYYVFNVGENNGFIIVSGDDVATPILGYSEKGSYNEDNLPPAFVYWMNCLKSEIDYAIRNGLKTDDKARKEWDSYLSGSEAITRSTQVVTPFLQTEWDQYEPYNNLCPMVGTNRAVTGCVATAMAQVMKYYEYPAVGKGQSVEYTTTIGTTIPSVSFEVPYEWNKMENIYSGSSSLDSKDAVATLMYHCGVSVQMDYNVSSGAQTKLVARSLVNHFYYDQSVQYKTRAFYSNEEWESVLKNELNRQRPVIYSGRNENSGHAFICHGYDDTGKFYFNWGWGGYKDGYYVLNALNPGSGGAGSGSGTYNQSQAMMINIMPDNGGAKTYELKIREETDISSTSSSVDRGEVFSVSGTIHNAGLNDFSGLLGVALVDDSDNIISVIGGIDFSLSEGYIWNRTISVSVPSSVDPGNYKIRFAVKPSDADEWEFVYGAIGGIDILDIEVKSAIIPDASNILMYNFDSGAAGLTYTQSEFMSGYPIEIVANYANFGSAFSGEFDLGIYALNGANLELKQLIDKKFVSIGSGIGTSTTFSNSAITVPAGTYKLVLFAKAATGDRKEVASNGNFKNNIDITIVGDPTSVAHGVASDFILYPNPAKDFINVSGLNDIQSVQIIDLSGNLKKSFLVNNMIIVNIPVQELPDGVYFIKVKTADNIFTKKFIKK